MGLEGGHACTAVMICSSGVALTLLIFDAWLEYAKLLTATSL